MKRAITVSELVGPLRPERCQDPFPLPACAQRIAGSIISTGREQSTWVRGYFII